MTLCAITDKNRDIWSMSYIKLRVRKARLRAAQKGYEFTLTSDEMGRILEQQDWRCYYTGIKFTNDPDDKYNWSIDRVDPRIGYVEENVVACCTVINTQKGRSSATDFIASRWNVAEINRQITGSREPVTHFDAWAAVIIPHTTWMRGCRKWGWNTSIPRAGRGVPYIAPISQNGP